MIWRDPPGVERRRAISIVLATSATIFMFIFLAFALQSAGPGWARSLSRNFGDLGDFFGMLLFGVIGIPGPGAFWYAAYRLFARLLGLRHG